MSPEATEHSTPTDPNDPTRGFGLKRELHAIFEWSQREGVDDTLIRLLDASKTDEHHRYLGTLLKYLQNAKTKAILEMWAEDSNSCKSLFDLSCALGRHSFDSTSHPPLPFLKSAASQLTGGLLTELPIVALTARPVPTGDGIAVDWIEELRAWVFVQNFDQSALKGWASRYLEEATSKLRLGIDTEPDWLKFFGRLVCPTSSYSAIKRALADKCELLQEGKKQPSLEHKHTILLANLKSFAQGKDRTHVGERDIGLYRKYLQRQLRGGLSTLEQQSTWDLPLTDSSSDEDSFMAEVHQVEFDAQAQDEDSLLFASSNAEETPPEQARQATGILLRTAAQNQHLTYEWSHPNLEEIERLWVWIHTVGVGTTSPDQLLAALVEIAMITSSTLETVLAFGIATETGPEWSLDVDDGTVHRAPPRRHHGWKVSPPSLRWVRTLASKMAVRLSSGSASALRYAASHGSAPKNLGNLWPANSGGKSASCFNNICKKNKGMERLSSGMISQVAGFIAFQKSQDSALSSLVSSHPRSGLGGACAYYSYTTHEVNHVLSAISPLGPPDVTGSTVSSMNAAGSQLDPLDTELRLALKNAASRTESLAKLPTAWCDHHNALTAYIVICLLSSTAARPVNSPFESIQNFDWREGFMFIEDKVSSSLHQGRLAPVLPQIQLLLEKTYLPHLARLISCIENSDPALAEQIRLLADSKVSTHLPYFFFLKNVSGVLHWEEVRESTLSDLELFGWPLPWNLMRHRLPTRLKAIGVNHEVIDGLTGHSQSGTASYGPYSLRTWSDDSKVLLPALNQALSSLDIRPPTAPEWNINSDEHHIYSRPSAGIDLTRRFGSAARKNRREDGHDDAKTQAKSEIEEFVNARSLGSFSPVEWETLSKSMLLHEDGRPRTLGTLRYAVMLDWLSSKWGSTGQKPRIKRRYIPKLEESSPFSAQAVNALEKHSHALEALTEQFKNVQPSRISQREARAAGILFLILESRVCDKSVIEDLLTGVNYRLVKFESRGYLEQSPSLDANPNLPVRRYRIGDVAAKLFIRALSAKNHPDIRSWSTPANWEAMVEKLAGKSTGSVGFENLARRIIEFVGQSNLLKFPGLVAGYLNGDFISVGLSHSDWIRTQIGQAMAAPSKIQPAAPERGVKEGAQDPLALSSFEEYSTTDLNDDPFEDGAVGRPETALHENYSPVAIVGANANGSSKQSSSEEYQRVSVVFFQALRSAFKVEQSGKLAVRRDIDLNLRRCITENQAIVSSSCLLLAEWLRSLLWVKTNKGLLRTPSVLRYFNALSVCFLAIAYEHDLADCDDDGVTDFYSAVMEVRRSVRPDLDISAGAAKANSNESAQIPKDFYKSQKLALSLLRNFHSFAAERFFIEEPDWSEIVVADDQFYISPGVIRELEYQHALGLLASHPNGASREDLAKAFILLVAFRFGLRGSEVTGLRRSDWIEIEGKPTVILVRQNHHRKLKTLAARRQVPLLFDLSHHEREIVQCWLASFDAQHLAAEDGPLFATDVHSSRLMDGKRLRNEVTRVLKQVTKNPSITLHHARHSFANAALLLLVDSPNQIWPAFLNDNQRTPAKVANARKLLLGSSAMSRRTLWALAGLMGHAHPSTAVRSYIHVLPDLANAYLPSSNTIGLTKVGMETGIGADLDSYVPDETYLSDGPQAMQVGDSGNERTVTYEKCIRLLTNCMRGISIESAARSVQIPTEFSNVLMSAIHSIDAILLRRLKSNPPPRGISTLLGHIPNSRWTILHKLALSIKTPTETDIPSLPDLTALSGMIGSSRHIVLSEERHFAFFKFFCEEWSLVDNSFSLHFTEKGRSELIAQATLAGINVELHTVAKNLDSNARVDTKSKRNSNVQIDSVTLSNGRLVITQRCGVIAKTGANSLVRSSYELLMMFLISLAIQFFLRGRAKEG